MVAAWRAHRDGKGGFFKLSPGNSYFEWFFDSDRIGMTLPLVASLSQDVDFS